MRGGACPGAARNAAGRPRRRLPRPAPAKNRARICCTFVAFARPRFVVVSSLVRAPPRATPSTPCPPRLLHDPRPPLPARPSRPLLHLRSPRNPAEMKTIMSLPQSSRPHRTQPNRGGVCVPPRDGAVRGAPLPLCRTSIFSLRFRLVSCRIVPRHAHCIEVIRRERSVGSKLKTTKEAFGCGSKTVSSVSLGCTVRHTSDIEDSRKERRCRYV